MASPLISVLSKIISETVTRSLFFLFSSTFPIFFFFSFRNLHYTRVCLLFLGLLLSSVGMSHAAFRISSSSSTLPLYFSCRRFQFLPQRCTSFSFRNCSIIYFSCFRYISSTTIPQPSYSLFHFITSSTFLPSRSSSLSDNTPALILFTFFSSFRLFLAHFFPFNSISIIPRFFRVFPLNSFSYFARFRVPPTEVFHWMLHTVFVSLPQKEGRKRKRERFSWESSSCTSPYSYATNQPHRCTTVY